MTSFVVTAVDWFNAYRRTQLETLMSLYDDGATQACTCDSRKMIAGKQALRAYWIDRFTTHPASDLVGLISQADGASVAYLTSDGVVEARLIFDEQGKIAHVICGLEGLQVSPEEQEMTSAKRHN
jgi:ketosteroid isomerase-like protein